MSQYSVALVAQSELVSTLLSPGGRRQLRLHYDSAPGPIRLAPQVREAASAVGYRLLEAAAATAEPVFLSAELTRVIAHAAESLDDWTLRAEDLLIERGFLWLAEPLPHPDPAARADAPPLRALLWSLLETPMAHCTLWFCACGTEVAATGERLPQAMPLGAVVWPVGGALSALPYSDRWLPRFAASLFAFMQQRIVRARPDPAPRSIRRQAERALRREVEAVQVITLRQTERPSQDEVAEPRDVAWTCSWLVSGHWRRQWYASEARHRRIWIAPYRKGPADRPLRVSRRVFKVVR